METTKHKLEKLLLISSTFLVLSFLSLATFPQALKFTQAATFPHGPVPESAISVASSSSSTGINMAAVPNTITTASDSASVSTTTITGYNLKFSTNSTSSNLEHLSLSGYSIPTISAATPLTNNSWGFSLTNPDPTPLTANFSTVPSSAAPTTLKSTSIATDDGTTDIPDVVNIYYGAKVDSTIPSGTYGNTVLYTATSNLVDAPSITSVSPSTGPTTGGTTITITGDNFDSTTNVTVDGEDCFNIQIISNTQITCDTPSNVNPGPVDVTITTQGGEETLTDGFTYQLPITYCGTTDFECIIFTINTSDGTYNIPTGGRVAGMDHSYNWDVYINDVLTTDCPSGNCTGTSGMAVPEANGIALTGLTNGQHQIKILSHNGPAPGWGNAFGHRFGTVGAANTATNKNKMITLDAPLTTMAFVPKTTESITDASSMFNGIFNGCNNLTTPASFTTTYTLPSTFTNLSWFLNGIHYPSKLTDPVDLTGLAGFLDNNTTITNLSGFLDTAHDGSNLLTTPIDLTPLSGWFNGNNSITDLSDFLRYTHNSNTNLTATIDLSPLSGWFNANTSITDLHLFMTETYLQSPKIIDPIDLSPISGWFYHNNSITNLSDFLEYAHISYVGSDLSAPVDLTPITDWFYHNTSITHMSSFLWYAYSAYPGNTNLTTPTDLTPIAEWFSANNSIIDLGGFLGGVHYYNFNLSDPIDLSPVSGWFNANTSVTYLGGFLHSTHTSNIQLTNPINLTPLSGWFNANTSITDISAFLPYTHQDNLALTSPIDLTPLSDWFASNRSFTANINGFLRETHANNPNLALTGQTIYPNWIKTAKQNSIDIWNTSNAFYQTFYLSTAQGGDTGEPKFQDGTVLSSIGSPITSNQAYRNRTGLTSLVPANWR